MKMEVFPVIVLALLAAASGPATAAEERTRVHLLRVADGLQMPGSESDSEWFFISFPGESRGGLRLPRRAGGGTSRSDLDATLGSLSEVESWMEKGQRKSARGFARLHSLFHREFPDGLAVYRCETGGPQVYNYFVGLEEGGLAGLLTVSIET